MAGGLPRFSEARRKLSEEMSARNVHSAGTVVLSLLMAIIGVALVTQAIAGHGSLLSGRLLLGVLFVAAGAGRLYAQERRRRGASRR